jgi:hypothetical protein
MPSVPGGAYSLCDGVSRLCSKSTGRLAVV